MWVFRLCHILYIRDLFSIIPKICWFIHFLYMRKILHRKYPKLFWNYVNSKTKSRLPISDLKKTNGDMTANDEENAQVLNEFFSSVFAKENLKEIPEAAKKEPHYQLTELHFTSEDIEKNSRNSKPSKSPGLDYIHPRILKELAEEISESLNIFHTSLHEGILPMDWLVAHITPIHKKGSKTDAGNYRPVILTSAVCKIMKGLIRDHVVKHMKKNKFFFRKISMVLWMGGLQLPSCLRPLIIGCRV